jgi:hypothetical protein
LTPFETSRIPSRARLLLEVGSDEEAQRVFDASVTLAKYGISDRWSPGELRVAVIARLPRSADRKLFNLMADACKTSAELIELAATTLEAFKKRQTPLRPPPFREDSRKDFTSESSGEPATPYSVK